MIVVILAGGKGSRLWPLSNSDQPKQFLKIKDHLSLLQKTYLRFSSCKVVEQIIVVTNEKHKSILDDHLKEINAKCLVVTEPWGKNTAPAICLALKYIEEKLKVSSKTKILVSPSDHLIQPQEEFQKKLEFLDKIDFEESIITFGIRPSKPETGYGYVKVDSQKSHTLLSVEAFIEKPTIEKAKEFLLDDGYFWNAGMFLFSLKIFWKEMKDHCPEFYAFFQKDFSVVLASFKELQSISLDYALMEKTKNIRLIPLNVAWSDIGSWDSLFDVLEKDENDNVIQGKILAVDTKNCLIFANKRKISAIGLKDIIVVETEEGIYIGKKGHSQKIKSTSSL